MTPPFIWGATPTRPVQTQIIAAGARGVIVIVAVSARSGVGVVLSAAFAACPTIGHEEVCLIALELATDLRVVLRNNR